MVYGPLYSTPGREVLQISYPIFGAIRLNLDRGWVSAKSDYCRETGVSIWFLGRVVVGFGTSVMSHK